MRGMRYDCMRLTIILLILSILLVGLPGNSLNTLDLLSDAFPQDSESINQQVVAVLNSSLATADLDEIFLATDQPANFKQARVDNELQLSQLADIVSAGILRSGKL